MISIGSNVRNMSAPLKKVTVQYLADAIRHPKPEISAQMRQLRIVRQLNVRQYTELKSQLPFFVCAIFNPSFRSKENFAYTEYFVMDIDNLSEKNFDIVSLKKRLIADGRVMMCFISPGSDGLKLMFRLDERCYDAGLYKVFYRLFVDRFSQQYDLQQVVDARTCDVSRACFISVDSEVYYNEQCEAVSLKTFVDVENNVDSVLQLKREQDIQVKQQLSSAPVQDDGQDIDADVLNQIRKTLNPNARIRKKPPVYVPEELEQIMENLKIYVEEKGICLMNVINISYGKKLRFKLGLKQAEINLFFGKRGFSVVQSPRTGTDAELNSLMADVIEAFIAEKV